ncbi:MAG: class I SAM-dependent methyltransferase, partial [Candidatus Zixiibacteriota bacterium]
KNINLIISDFSETLDKLNETKQNFDFVFIDGNHRYNATLDYFKKLKILTHSNSILVFDDIHWSSDMQQAWQTITADKSVTLSLDIFQFGIVFFKKELSKQHFVLRY